jgi:hypothetical protein
MRKQKLPEFRTCPPMRLPRRYAVPLLWALAGVVLLGWVTSTWPTGIGERFQAVLHPSELGSEAVATGGAAPLRSGPGYGVPGLWVAGALLGQSGSYSGSSGGLGELGRPSQPAHMGTGDLRGGQAIDFQSLIDLITTTIAPDTWEEVGGTGRIKEFPGGVFVDLRRGGPERKVEAEFGGELGTLRDESRQGQAVPATSPSEVIARRSPFRKVSVTRLERIVARLLAEKKPIPEEMRLLAGLTEARHLFVYPDTGDLVLAGPAEPWHLIAEGAAAVGQQSRKPILQLDDFVTLLRVALPDGPGIYACGIYPRREGLARVQKFLETAPPVRTVSDHRDFMNELARQLGVQDVRIWGVPAGSRVACILVAADYHMKLIGIGLADGGPEVPSYVEMLRVPPSGRLAGLETLRWWFTPQYEAVLTTAANHAFRLEGRGVQLLAENELLAEGGQRVPTGSATLLNQRFARQFTTHFDKLAERYPIYAELRNVFDLTMIASLIVNYELASRVKWDYGAFGSKGAYEPTAWHPPRTVDSVLNHRVLEERRIEDGRVVRRKHFVTVVSGGVVVNPWPVVKHPATSAAVATSVGAPSEAILRQRPSVPPDPTVWWWD